MENTNAPEFVQSECVYVDSPRFFHCVIFGIVATSTPFMETSATANKNMNKKENIKKKLDAETRTSKSECGLPKLHEETENRAKSTFSTYTDLQKSYRKSQVNRTISRLQKSWGSQNRQLLAASKEMRQELDFLKEQYLTVCEQESALRSQIALLTAEIVLMETNEYHRIPLNVRKISVDPLSVRKLPKTKLNRPHLERPTNIAKQLSLETAVNKNNKIAYRIYNPKRLTAMRELNSNKANRLQNNSKPKLEAKLQSTEKQKQAKHKKTPEENMLHYCPYCSVFCHPSQAPLPCAMRTPSTACVADFRLPKLDAQHLKATAIADEKN